MASFQKSKNEYVQKLDGETQLVKKYIYYYWVIFVHKQNHLIHQEKPHTRLKKRCILVPILEQQVFFNISSFHVSLKEILIRKVIIKHFLSIHECRLGHGSMNLSTHNYVLWWRGRREEIFYRVDCKSYKSCPFCHYEAVVCCHTCGGIAWAGHNGSAPLVLLRRYCWKSLMRS